MQIIEANERAIRYYENYSESMNSTVTSPNNNPQIDHNSSRRNDEKRLRELRLDMLQLCKASILQENADEGMTRVKLEEVKKNRNQQEYFQSRNYMNNDNDENLDVLDMLSVSAFLED